MLWRRCALRPARPVLFRPCSCAGSVPSPCWFMAAALHRLWLRSGSFSALSGAARAPLQLATTCSTPSVMQLAWQHAAAAPLAANPAGRRAEPVLGRLQARLACSHTTIGPPWRTSGRRSYAVAAAGVPPAAAAAAAPSAPHSAPSAAPVGTALTHFSSLYIRDFALVQEQRLHLAPGLTAITGKRAPGLCQADLRCNCFRPFHFAGLQTTVQATFLLLINPTCSCRRVGLRQVGACGGAGPGAGGCRIR